MTNTINTINETQNHTNISRFSQAPDYIPKYSIHKVCKEKDEFRKTVIANQRKTMKEKNNKFSLSNILAFSAAVVGFIMLHVKKII